MSLSAPLRPACIQGCQARLLWLLFFFHRERGGGSAGGTRTVKGGGGGGGWLPCDFSRGSEGLDVLELGFLKEVEKKFCFCGV